jgi:hypothetical protein
MDGWVSGWEDGWICRPIDTEEPRDLYRSCYNSWVVKAWGCRLWRGVRYAVCALRIRYRLNSELTVRFPNVHTVVYLLVSCTQFRLIEYHPKIVSLLQYLHYVLGLCLSYFNRVNENLFILAITENNVAWHTAVCAQFIAWYTAVCVCWIAWHSSMRAIYCLIHSSMRVLDCYIVLTCYLTLGTYIKQLACVIKYWMLCTAYYQVLCSNSLQTKVSLFLKLPN